MVYCGKPSKCCRQCRNRDIKCDKKKDSCGQCKRAKISCPGYNDQSKLVVRDETKAVILKYCNGVQKLGKPLSLDLEDHAKRLFVSRYVKGESASFPYMETFWAARPQNPALWVAVRAVSLAFLSVQHKDHKILHQARKRYGTALHLVNNALKSPEAAGDNSTLVTVLLLDLFEQLSSQCTNYQIQSTSKHLQGALALIKFTGICDSLRMCMFHYTSMTILAACVEHTVDVPPELISLHQSLDVKDSELQVEYLLISLIADWNMRQTESQTDKKEKLARLCELQQRVRPSYRRYARG